MDNETILPPLPAGTVVTAALVATRLQQIEDLCVAGLPLDPIITELRYLADCLESAR
jgi:hypothetical protein